MTRTLLPILLFSLYSTLFGCEAAEAPELYVLDEEAPDVAPDAAPDAALPDVERAALLHAPIDEEDPFFGVARVATFEGRSFVLLGSLEDVPAPRSLEAWVDEEYRSVVLGDVFEGERVFRERAVVVVDAEGRRVSARVGLPRVASSLSGEVAAVAHYEHCSITEEDLEGCIRAIPRAERLGALFSLGRKGVVAELSGLPEGAPGPMLALLPERANELALAFPEGLESVPRRARESLEALPKLEENRAHFERDEAPYSLDWIAQAHRFEGEESVELFLLDVPLCSEAHEPVRLYFHLSASGALEGRALDERIAGVNLVFRLGSDAPPMLLVDLGRGDLGIYRVDGPMKEVHGDGFVGCAC